MVRKTKVSKYEQELIDKVNKNKDSYLIWACGHKDFHIDNDNICSFNVNENHSLKNICEYNRLFNEFTCWYYVWKNNLQTKYVITAHYNKIPLNINIDKINEGYIQYYYLIHRFNYMTDKHYYKDFGFIHNQIFEFCAPTFMFDDVIEYLNDVQKTLNVNDIIAYTQYTENGYSFIQREIFATDWNTYCDIIKFIDNYIQFIGEKYNLKNIDDWKNHISSKILTEYINNEKTTTYNFLNMCYQSKEKFDTIHKDDFGYNDMNNCWRVYGYIIEILISVYIMTHKHYIKIN